MFYVTGTKLTQRSAIVIIKPDCVADIAEAQKAALASAKQDRSIFDRNCGYGVRLINDAVDLSYIVELVEFKRKTVVFGFAGPECDANPVMGMVEAFTRSAEIVSTGVTETSNHEGVYVASLGVKNGEPSYRVNGVWHFLERCKFSDE